MGTDRWKFIDLYVVSGIDVSLMSEENRRKNEMERYIGAWNKITWYRTIDDHLLAYIQEDFFGFSYHLFGDIIDPDTLGDGWIVLEDGVYEKVLPKDEGVPPTIDKIANLIPIPFVHESGQDGYSLSCELLQEWYNAKADYLDEFGLTRMKTILDERLIDYLFASGLLAWRLYHEIMERFRQSWYVQNESLHEMTVRFYEAYRAFSGLFYGDQIDAIVVTMSSLLAIYFYDDSFDSEANALKTLSNLSVFLGTSDYDDVRAFIEKNVIGVAYAKDYFGTDGIFPSQRIEDFYKMHGRSVTLRRLKTLDKLDNRS